MDYLSQLKKGMDELTAMFTEKMSAFEESLGSTSQSKDTASIACEFRNFKSLMWKTVSGLNAQMKLVHQLLDDSEMRARAKVLLVHGLVESRDEDISDKLLTMFKDKLHLHNISSQVLVSCHRLGSNIITGKPRPVLIRFLDHHTRRNVWEAKKMLKGTGLTVTEFLTASRHAVFLEARKSLGVKGCWTNGGKIVVVCPDGSRRKITSISELRSIKNAEKTTVQISESSVEPAARLNKGRSTRMQSKAPNK